MHTKSILIFTLLAGMLTACNLPGPATVIPTETPIPPTPIQLFPTPSLLPTEIIIPPTAIPLPPEQAVLARAGEVVQALKNKDMLSLAGYVHPVDGLRFSPYAYVKSTDLVFPSSQIPGSMSDNTLFTWGIYDGSGLSIDMTFTEYYAQFIYDVDFANAPQVAVNERIGKGNSIDNSLEFYPGAMIVEYHFPGFEAQYQGMDWRSLRLVFMDYNNTWYLVGIIHDQWTI